jgi:hypothetical protein
VQVEGARHRGRVAAVLDVGEGRLLHPRVGRRRQLIERREGSLGEPRREAAGLE